MRGLAPPVHDPPRSHARTPIGKGYIEGVGVESLVAWGHVFLFAVTFSSTSFRSCLVGSERDRCLGYPIICRDGLLPRVAMSDTHSM